MKATDYQAACLQRVPVSGRVMENAVLGVLGELGELLNCFRKHHYQGHPLDGVEAELGDVGFYVALAHELDGEDLRLTNPDGAVDVLTAGVEMARAVLDFCDGEEPVEGLAEAWETLCVTCGRVPAMVLAANDRKLAARYPDGFTPERSMNR